MNIQKMLFLIILIHLSAFAFSQEDRRIVINHPQAMNIDLTKAEVGKIPMSQVFDSIEYVALETTDKCILKSTSRYYVTDQYIIAMNVFYNTYLFDRKTGKFIREIGNDGQHNRHMLSRNGFDETNQIIYADDIEQFVGYDIENEKSSFRINKPIQNRLYLYEPFSLGDNTYMSLVKQTEKEKDSFKLIVYDAEGSILKSYPYPYPYDLRFIARDDRPSPNPIFYRLNDELYLAQTQLMDTTYRITDTELVPHIIMHTGNKPLSDDVVENEMSEKINLHLVRETDRFIFFTYGIGHSHTNDFSGYYDKQTQKTYISSELFNEKHNGFINDIDHLPSFTPIYINENKEVVGAILIEDLLEQINAGDTTKMNDKTKELISTVEKGSNPIVVIAHPKK